MLKINILNKYIINKIIHFKKQILLLSLFFIFFCFKINENLEKIKNKIGNLWFDGKKNNSVLITNIDLNDEFFQLQEVKEQIYKNNLTYITTISGGAGNVGNSLLMLNNLINICEKIKCRNIIAPFGLKKIIKNPIIYKKYNITIYPESFRNKTTIDILLSVITSYYFYYRKKRHEMRLSIIREEVLNNVPKYISYPNDLYINIRSGDIFIDKIHPYYSQPPLCFYQKIINDNNYNNIYLLSNGHENPVVNALLKIYPKIIYIHGPVEKDISVLINAYNLVMPISTFPIAIITLNNNLKNLYIYEIINYSFQKGNYIIHKMKPSIKYEKIMKRKWKNTRDQLDLMIKEECFNSSLKSYSAKNSIFIFRNEIIYYHEN